MGQPVKIVDLAERMIRLSGLEPGRDIDITFTGVRPGERLHEILFAREEPTAPIGIEGIVAAKPVSPSLEAMRGWLAALEQGLAREDRSVIYRRAARRGAGFQRRSGVSSNRALECFRWIARAQRPGRIHRTLDRHVGGRQDFGMAGPRSSHRSSSA